MSCSSIVMPLTASNFPLPFSTASFQISRISPLRGEYFSGLGSPSPETRG